MREARITIQLLGGASLRSGDAPLSGPPAQRHRIALFALLAVAWPQPLPRDRAMVLLWPEKNTASARRLLNLAVHVLRNALGEGAIMSTGDALLLDPAFVDCDLLSLRAAVAEGALDRVARLYTGPLLDGFHLSDSPEFGYWLDERRAEIQHLYTDALLALAERQERAGDAHGRVATCRRLVAVDPCSGRFALALMRALDAEGDRAGAIQHASDYARRVRAELELDPEPEVVALAERLRREPARERSGPPPRVEPGARNAAAAGEHRALRRWLRWPATATALVLLALAGYALVKRAHPEPPPASAAVLPFVDLSPDHNDEYFSDGLTDELITTLGKVPGLRVAARTSSFQFKARNADVRKVGRRLGVGAVLEGSVRRRGERLRVTAALIDVKDGDRLWSASYDRRMSDIFEVQEDVARSIAAALRLRLTPSPDSALAVRPTTDLEAYDLYLKGLFAWNQRTGPALGGAVRYLEHAVARDSTFARALAALADAYLLAYPYGAGGSLEDNWRRARDAATRALAVDPTSAEAYTALGYGNTIYGWNWDEAEKNFRRAIAADPNYALGHHWYADFLAGRGRLAESLEQVSIAHRLDPLSRQIGAEWGWITYELHRNDAAAARIRQTLELDPNYAQGHMRLGMVQIQQHRYAKAIASLQRSIDLGVFEPQATAAIAFAYGVSGDRASALRVIQEMERRYAAGEFLPPYSIAVGYAGLGETARGIEWIARGIDERDIYLPENFFDPLLDPLRGDPGYSRVLARMGIDPRAPSR